MTDTRSFMKQNKSRVFTMDRTIIILFVLTVLGIIVLDFYGDIDENVTFENYTEHCYYKMKTLVSNTIVTGCSGWHTHTKYPKSSK